MLKLILVDLDGTLLKDHYIISEKNKKAIEYAKSKNVLIGINTGRNGLSALLFSSIAGMNAPVCCCNGGFVFNHLNRNKLGYNNMGSVRDELTCSRHIFKSRLDKEAVSFAAGVTRELDTHFLACTDEGYYIVGQGREAFTMNMWEEQARDMIKVDMKRFSDADEFLDRLGDKVIKLSFSSYIQGGLSDVCDKWQGCKGVKLTNALGSILEVTARGVDKGMATIKLCEHLGISTDNVGCIGDDTNDIAMFKVCGKRVAMGQGVEELKAISDYVVSNCNEDGCSEGIYRLLD